VEVKPEFGMGGGCAYLQSTAYYTEFIGEFAKSPVLIYSRLPMFQLYLAGPYLGVAGTVFLDVVVCKLLTTVMPLYFLPYDTVMMRMVAHTFKALKVALVWLEEFYRQLLQSSLPENQLQLMPLYFNSVAGTELTYHNKLENGRYVFRARLGERDVVVKFTKSYSRKCHKACYGLGIAPELMACKRLAGGWFAVVMEYLCDHEMLQMHERKDQLWKAAIDAVIKMHDAGFVHGNLRLPNIMVGPDDAIKIIDFDWSGKQGEVVYPPFCNTEINWHPDVAVGVEIRMEHDLYLLGQKSYMPFKII